jgi:hypothetical protein
LDSCRTGKVPGSLSRPKQACQGDNSAFRAIGGQRSLIPDSYFPESETCSSVDSSTPGCVIQISAFHAAVRYAHLAQVRLTRVSQIDPIRPVAALRALRQVTDASSRPTRLLTDRSSAYADIRVSRHVSWLYGACLRGTGTASPMMESLLDRTGLCKIICVFVF